MSVLYYNYKYARQAYLHVMLTRSATVIVSTVSWKLCIIILYLSQLFCALCFSMTVFPDCPCGLEVVSIGDMKEGYQTK